MFSIARAPVGVPPRPRLASAHSSSSSARSDRQSSENHPRTVAGGAVRRAGVVALDDRINGDDPPRRAGVFASSFDVDASSTTRRRLA
jgi:hypothetical protein